MPISILSCRVRYEKELNGTNVPFPKSSVGNYMPIFMKGGQNPIVWGALESIREIVSARVTHRKNPKKKGLKVKANRRLV